ncbi:MAG TPA: tRNA (adenosine(37)-N6)-threonylcarbamoyltransferase complex ATPase subunit type 1 TsaE [Nitrospirota bacterium]|nr:tRNA (adenosine(37)-N6)-threonylcarbamoyltransferase complex ATPase subunit type 1 TsaE [Nitrospirota bacterium]
MPQTCVCLLSLDFTVYEEFYELAEKPFNKTPDPRFLFQSRKHAEALARLYHAVEEQDIVLLTGEIGSGKTTLSRAFIDGLDASFHPMLIINPRLSPSQLLHMVALRLGMEDLTQQRHGILEGINAKLYEIYEAGRRPVIIIDEAQLIPSKATFEELRLLTNFQLDNRNLLAIALIGQTELRERLNRKPYKALRQRIGMQYHLGPLDREETEAYVLHRLRVAGREAPLFDSGAMELLYRYSGGIPRRINIVAGNALIEGFGREAQTIGADIVENVVKDG